MYSLRRRALGGVQQQVGGAAKARVLATDRLPEPPNSIIRQAHVVKSRRWRRPNRSGNRLIGLVYSET
ncbi:Low specificity L-threonine aldolase [Fusarium oxysporum f. sp. albedinis]|nr:Low specificity L-threonine aldolase [Fusarium oxysporum f. sp. albedinis]